MEKKNTKNTPCETPLPKRLKNTTLLDMPTKNSSVSGVMWNVGVPYSYFWFFCYNEQTLYDFDNTPVILHGLQE